MTNTRATAPSRLRLRLCLAASEENARGHLVITAPTGGSAGVMPAIVYALIESKRKLSKEKAREGLLAGAAIGYLCKHNATLSGAEGGCQSEIGVASAMSAAFIAQVDGQLAAGDRERRRVGARTSSRHDLRPGRRLRAGALHRALCLRRGEGLDRLHDRDQRDRSRGTASISTPRSRPWPRPARTWGEVQGNQRRRPGREPGPLLKKYPRTRVLETHVDVLTTAQKTSTDNEVIVELQTDAPLKGAIMPNGACRRTACSEFPENLCYDAPSRSWTRSNKSRGHTSADGARFLAIGPLVCSLMLASRGRNFIRATP